MAESAWATRGVVAALAASLLVTGCARVPTSGAAVSVRDVPPVAVDDFSDVRLQPLRPSRGETPEAIVRGFVAAMKSATGGHEIGRSYLTTAASDAWRDDAGTQIVTVASLTSTSGPSGTVRVRLAGRQQATLAKDGAYVPTDKRLGLDLRLQKVQGEWRIANPPPGVLMPSEDFQQVYRSVDLFFLSPDGGTVVPDRRYFDVKAAALPTRMAQALLAGASDWLSPGVRTAFPDGTRLRSNVIRDGDFFVVDLSSDVLAASPSDQAALAAQLVWTLVKRFSVAGLRLLADGRPLRVQSGDGLLKRDAYAGYDPRVVATQVPAYYLSNGSLRGYGSPTPTSPAAAAGAGLVSAAMSADQKWLAGVRRRDGWSELVAGPLSNPLVMRYRARSVSRPSWESGSAAVYVVVDGRDVVRVPIGGRAVPVPTPGLVASGPVRAMALSRDGARVAVVAGPTGQGQLLVGVLGRTPGALRITGLRPVAPQLTGVLDVGWSGETELLVLGSLGGAAAGPQHVDVDGAQVTEGTSTGLPVDREHLAAAPGEADLVEAGGHIWQRSRSGWGSPLYEQTPAGAAPFYPG
ncbi:MAG: LpqB family beta-propeller domain-containing protein [Mycobacteriales bacterium]